ncbi:zinc-binding dehydrogenase [Duganella sp. FT92W]|uniref:Zinc-binding dehydrogenase n=1 Tax=Pseudoduganella rivuli TaxID=2666085 RepID=A0A7X2LWM2_9BURK|nr:ester cyclase [Pseudoduganella rivuli]MRV76711.1 zinc-binding dehydrogenase [Pseudoduganella rivuli]
MSKRVRIYQPGPASAMVHEDTPALPAPAAGEVRLRHEAIGVNFVDTMFRSGAFRAPLPLEMGVEGAGVIEQVGPGVTGFTVGDRVAYFFSFGAYADERLIEARHLVKLPRYISSDTAAATFTKGLTAWMMLYGAHQVHPGEVVLVHGAAGGVGSIVARWAKALGATVIATVGTAAKAASVRSYGIEHVLDANDPKLAQRVLTLTGGRGVDVVYELIGKATFAQSVAALRAGGELIHVGNASGSPDIDQEAIAARNIRYMQPSTGQYVAERTALERASADLFRAIEQGIFGQEVPAVYSLNGVARAHQDLADRKILGSAILRPAVPNVSDIAKAVVRRNTEEVQGGGNFALFDELFADAFVDHTPQPNCTPDKPGARALYEKLREAFPDFHAVIHWQTADGDRVTTYKTYHGTHQGAFLGVQPTGRKIQFDTVDVMRVENGQITEHWGVAHLYSLMQQLGAIA